MIVMSGKHHHMVITITTAKQKQRRRKPKQKQKKSKKSPRQWRKNEMSGLVRFLNKATRWE